MKFDGKTALVTGSGGALGGVIARRFAEEGANLVLPLRSVEQQRTLMLALGQMPERLHCGITDLVDDAGVQALVAEAVTKFTTIDFLINCAGGYAGGSLVEEVSVDEWDTLMQMNLKSTFVTCRAVLPIMKVNRFGRIVNISALAALVPGAKKGPYQVSKRGVITLTETIAEETKGTGVTANAIAPSTILTEANKKSMPSADSSRWVPPEEIAHLSLFLCTDLARFISGNVIRM